MCDSGSPEFLDAVDWIKVKEGVLKAKEIDLERREAGMEEKRIAMKIKRIEVMNENYKEGRRN